MTDDETSKAMRDALISGTGYMSEWHPIETAPKDGTTVLGWFAGSEGYAIISWYATAGSGRWGQRLPFSFEIGYSDAAFTHWMPLPEPPK